MSGSVESPSVRTEFGVQAWMTGLGWKLLVDVGPYTQQAEAERAIKLIRKPFEKKGTYRVVARQVTDWEAVA